MANPKEPYRILPDGTVVLAEILVVPDDVVIEKGEFSTNGDLTSDVMPTEVIMQMNRDVTPTKIDNSDNLISGMAIANKIKAIDSKVNLHKTQIDIEIAIINAKNIDKIVNNLSSLNVTMSQGSATQAQATDKNTKMLQTLISAIEKQTKAIQEQKLTASHTTINRIDTEPLATATTELAKGVSSQIATNKKIVENIEKKNEFLDFQKNGLSTLTDTNNNKISPREVEALVNAEKYIEQKEINNTTMAEFMEFSGEIFDSLSAEAINEGGISANFNPFEHMLDEYKKEILNDKKDLEK